MSSTDALLTPCALVDVDRMHANLDRMAEYAALHALRLRPHVKTHKSPVLAREQLIRGAVGVTVAQLHEAHVMSDVCDDILLAHPPVGAAKLSRLLSLPSHVRLTVALDSAEALLPLAAAARDAGREVGVLVELDLGMHRVGIPDAEAAAALCERVERLDGVAWRGIMFYPGHIRQHVTEQDDAVADVNTALAHVFSALRARGLEPETVSAGSTPAAWSSHRMDGVNEIRPGTYIYNDRTTAAIGACAWDDCAYSVLATVISTAVPGQAVVDAGAKALSREEIRGADWPGLGALLDRPDIIVKGVSEEHGILDLSHTDWRPEVGERVRIVPNHVCVSVNLHPVIYAVQGDEVTGQWPVAARGWDVPGGSAT